MQKNEYIKIYNELTHYFKNDGEILDALEYINDAVNLNSSKIFMAQKSTSKKSHFSLPSNVTGKKNTFAVFSDGACRGNPGPGAWGTVIQESNEDVLATLSGMEFKTTNNQMELTGAIEGLRELERNLKSKCKNTEIFLYSDSKYVVDGITKWISGWKKRGWKKADKKVPENLELWKTLDELNTKFKKVYFNWVKGHAGHPQNEFCDQLANDALDDAGCH